MDENFDEMFKNHISDGEYLIKKLQEQFFINIRGVNKLQRKIKKDIQFLSEALQTNQMKKEHLNCLNLYFYKAIIEKAQEQSECEALLETVSYETADGSQKRLNVDIVSCKGHQWIKIVARNPSALHQIYNEGNTFGRRSIMDQALFYVQAASQNLNLYSRPQVVFSFVNGVPLKLKIYIETLGIKVVGKVISIEEDLSSSTVSLDSNLESSQETSNIASLHPSEQKSFSKLNLCVTTLIAYVSALTNGGSHYKFAEPILNQQAEWERARPMKPLLDNLFRGKELVCCTAALEDFKKIVRLVGGEEEKCRASDLLSRVMEVPAVFYPGLKLSGRIKRRSLEIFGTGYALQAPTVTANKGFLQSALQKRARFAAIVHESRALTERKQLTALLSLESEEK